MKRKPSTASKAMKPVFLTSAPAAPIASAPSAPQGPGSAREPLAKPWTLEEMQEAAAAMVAKMRKFPVDLRD
jgi:hypothetical protein